MSGNPSSGKTKKKKRVKKKPELPPLESGRTYSREELEKRIPKCDNEFVSFLIQFFGLIPMGKSQHIFSYDNAITALMNHATGSVVPRQRNPIPRKQLREMMKQRRGDTNGSQEEEES